MGASHGDIIFFAIIAVYLGFKLFSVLGRKNDSDDKIDATKNNYMLSKLTDARAKKDFALPAVNNKPVVEEPVKNNLDDFVFENDSARAGMQEVIQKDNNFSLANFIEGAKIAFEMLLKAYSEDDKKTLKQLLAEPLYSEMESELNRIKSENHSSVKSLVAFEKIEIESASVTDNDVTIGLKFLTEQINTLRNAEGKIIEGDPKAIIVVEDNWVFERSLKSSNPNWTIISV